jgi:MFS family permease
MLVGILGTAIAAFTIDKVGRRRTLYWGAISLSIVLFIIGGLFRGAVDNPEKAFEYGTAASAMVFVYLLIFSSSWLMIPFIYPTEIFPTFLRAKGNAFGVAGWAIGYGGGSLLVPVMFAAIDEKVSHPCSLSGGSRANDTILDFLRIWSVSERRIPPAHLRLNSTVMHTSSTKG